MIKSSLKKKNSFILTSLDKSPSDILKFKNGNIRLIKKNSKAKINSISLTNNNNREKRNLSETSGNSKNSDKEKKNRKLLINKSLNLTNDFEKINKGRNSFLKRNGVKTENKSQLKISLDKLVYIKEPEKKKLNNSKNLSLNIENSKNENKKKYGVKILHSRNLNSETINYNSHKTFISFLEKTSNEIERKNSKNSLNNTVNLNNEDNNNIHFNSPKKNLKLNSFLINNKKNDNESNHHQLNGRSFTSKQMNYFYLKKNPTCFSSSNEQISTDTNLITNKNYSLINNNSNYNNNINEININNNQFNENFNSPIKKKSKNFHDIFHQSVREKIDEFDKRNDDNLNYPILKVRTLTKSNKSNFNINLFQEKNTSNESLIFLNNTSPNLINNDNFTFISNDIEIENKENNIISGEIDEEKVCDIKRKESNFLKKLKELHSKGLSNFRSPRKKKKKQTEINEDLIFLKDSVKSADSDISNLTKSPEKKKMKTFRTQLSKISELSLKNVKKEERESLKKKFSSLKQIIDLKNQINKLNRYNTLKVKKGDEIFNKLIEEIEKNNNNNFEIDASFESFDSEKRINKQPRKRANSILAFFRASSLRLSINELNFKIHKNLIDIKKQKLLKFCRFNIKEYNDKIEIIKNKYKDKLISDSFFHTTHFKNILKSNENLHQIILEKHKIYNNKRKNYFDDSSEKDTKKFYLDIIKLIKSSNNKVKNILPESIKRLLLKNNLKVNLYDHIIKGKYLEIDFGINENYFNENLLNHFEKMRRKTVKSLRKFHRHLTQILPIILSGKDIEYYNRFLITDTMLNFINEKEEEEEFEELLKKNQFKSSKFFRFSSHHHHLKITNEKTTIKSLRIRLSAKPSLIRANSTYSHHALKIDKKKITILNSHFFKRKRNCIANKLIEINKEKEEKKKINLKIRKKEIALYISPQNSFSEKRYLNNISLRKCDKELSVERTLKIKDDLIKKCKNDYEVLFLYIKYGEYYKFKKIFEYYKLSTEIYDNEGNSLLNVAVQCERKRIVKYLLLQDANPNSQNNKLNSPLHYALIYQNFEIADFLIKYGANENIKNGEGLTPWQCLNYDKKKYK
jgi:hypothetical protein